MLEIIKKNWDKNRITAIFGVVIALLILVAIAYKSDDKKTSKPKVFKTIDQSSDVINFKKFLIGQIKSPFININYDIVQGDTIQKILKKYKVKNREIQTVIDQYKKFPLPTIMFHNSSTSSPFKAFYSDKIWVFNVFTNWTFCFKYRIISLRERLWNQPIL